MHIKSVHIDGFKSYGRKVEVNGFDRQFNAITGLNGTGKSNILDSICFVLGISNLCHLRANSLQELIFKNGQAGVNSATVTIIFDNHERDISPPGYEHLKDVTVSRQVVMGGKNKYWINGCIVPNKKVQDLFCSIQLNINNPHFLIMQGRITKVLNMKPPDILAMLEEASGTHMYETKKISLVKTLEKKNAKLEELNTIIKEEISPRLDKLKQERQAYMEYTRIERELGHMKNLFEAFLFHASQRMAEQAEEKLDKLQGELANLQSNIQDNEAAIVDLTKEIDSMIEKQQQNSNGELERLESEVATKEDANVKSAAAVKAADEHVNREKDNLQKLEKSIGDDDKELSSKKNEMARMEGLYDTLKETDRRDEEAHTAAQRKYEFLCAGMEMNESGKAQSLQEQLIVANEEVSKQGTAIKVSSNKLAQCERELVEKEAVVRRCSGSSYEAAKANYDAIKKQVASMQAESEQLNYSEAAVSATRQAVEGIKGEMRQCRRTIDDFEARRPQASFNYRDPTPNFDRSQVYGMVCRLISVRDLKYATALETAAGGKLFNIVCANEKVSKLILERGQLQQRVTLLPLNKIQDGRISAKVVRLAQALVGAENVVPAIELVTFEARLRPVIEHVFGQVFVCKDLSVAKRVTFHPEIRRRCVTLDGDVTDPAGTMSGGAPSRSAPLLTQMHTLLEAEARLLTLDADLQRLQAELSAQVKVEELHGALRHGLEMNNIQLRNVELVMQETPYHQAVEEVDACRQQAADLRAEIAQATAAMAKAEQRIRTLDENMRDAGGYRERTLKEAEAEMKRAEQQAAESHAKWEQCEASHRTLSYAIEELAKMIESGRAQIASKQRDIEQLEAEHARLADELSASTQDLEALQAQLNAEKSAAIAKNKAVATKSAHRDKLLAQIAACQLDIKKRKHVLQKQREEVKKAAAKRQESEKRVARMDKKVVQEAAAMDDAGGENLRKRIARAEETRQTLGRNVNVNAQKMFDQEEKHHARLVSRQRIIESDRKRLGEVIKKLDAKKQDALTLAFNQVKKDFGSIFSTLLPDADCTLAPPANMTLLEGLEIRVSLGGVWKENLTELSGGQRSLAALSLILSMLLFKPAPLYILDEVDSALDLSHTQNIGVMLKAHFKQSQFIIVSLKDGMFSNANVLFRTKFIDGVSAVSRTVNKR